MRSYRIGSLFDIPIKLDLTFLLVLPLFAYIISVQVSRWATILNEVLGAGLEPAALAGNTTIAFALGITAAVGLFVGVVIHELGHSLVARRYDLEISSITLWLFGGIAHIVDMPEDWKRELYIAIAGPITSIVVGVASYLAFLAVPVQTPAFAAVRFVLGYLALMNVALAGFNLLPGFPMDGGRVLRALLARDRPYARATKIAADVGKGFAILLGLFGLFGGGGLFLVAIAFFIYIGASSEAQQTAMRAAFEGVTVDQVMTPRESVDTVSPDTTVAGLVERMFEERHTGYPVVEAGELVGMVTLEDAREIQDVERDAYAVEEIMSRELYTISRDADAMSAISQMQEQGVGRLLVMDDDGEFAGLISRTDLMDALEILKAGGSLDLGAGRSKPEPGASAPGSTR